MTARNVQSAPRESNGLDEMDDEQYVHGHEVASPRTSWLSLVLNISCITVYGYAIYFQNYHREYNLGSNPAIPESHD